jgi:hypothetical protein
MTIDAYIILASAAATVDLAQDAANALQVEERPLSAGSSRRRRRRPPARNSRVGLKDRRRGCR